MKDEVKNIKNEILVKLSDPSFISKLGVSIACVSAIIFLISSDFGSVDDANAGVCCYSNCYYNCVSCGW